MCVCVGKHAGIFDCVSCGPLTFFFVKFPEKVARVIGPTLAATAHLVQEEEEYNF